MQPGVALVFPRDHGAHPAYRTEWWYITGWVQDQRGNDFGVQITFFRNRPLLQEDNPSAFAPRQLLFAHAAIADPREGRLRHDQRAAREGFGIAYAREQSTDVRIDDWSLRLEGDRYLAQIHSREFNLELAFEAQRAASAAGPRRVQPQGAAARPGELLLQPPAARRVRNPSLDGAALPVTGIAWLDHEWSSEYLAAEAAGWDWIGINLDDGAALMAFRMRDKRGGVLWAGGTLREAGGRVQTFAPGGGHLRAAAALALRAQRGRIPRGDARCGPAICSWTSSR